MDPFIYVAHKWTEAGDFKLSKLLSFSVLLTTCKYWRNKKCDYKILYSK